MRRPLSLLALLVPAACGAGGATYEGPYRHVLLVSLDTTRADHLSCYEQGRAATPRLDALAAAGARFSDVTAAAPTTLASHTSLMTGSYPHTHGVVRNGFVVNEQNVMLAELLREQGFHTAGFLGSFALEKRFRFDQGFDVFDERFDVLADNREADQNQRLAEDVTAAALEHVKRVKDDAQRLFLFVHYFDPHAPYGPPVSQGAPRVTMQEVDAAVREHQRRILGQGYGHTAAINNGLVGELGPLAGAAMGERLPVEERIAAAYAGEVAYLDRCLGDLLDGLEGAGLLDETLILITADHGETFWEHGDLWNHGLWLYQTTVHVPLMVVLPDGRGAGRVVAAPVSNVDVLPTLCELLDIELPARNDGVSLVPLLDGRELERGPVFSEATQPWRVEQPGPWRNLGKPRAVRRGPWKLVRSPYNQVEQLFHLGDDPGEQHDLLRTRGGDPELVRLVRELRAELRAWDESASPLPSGFDSRQLEETLARLEAMGYSGESWQDEDD